MLNKVILGKGSNPNQSGQLGATVKPGSAPNQDTEATPNLNQNNTPTNGQDGDHTGQGTQVKPNPDQTATGTQGATGDQNTQQGNTEQNNQNAEQGNTGGTDKDAKVNTNDDETKQMLKMILNYLKQD